MGTTLPSGLKIVNVTPHVLNFWDERGNEMTVAPSDDVVNALPVSRNVYKNQHYTLVRVEFREMLEGLLTLARIRKDEPDAVIVGSIIAAQAYPGIVVASIPYKSNRTTQGQRLVKSDRFTTFLKENISNGS